MIYADLILKWGDVTMGDRSTIGCFSEINATGSRVIIGEDCDIASFVSINVADSHKGCVEESKTVVRRPIIIQDHVFIGSFVLVMGGAVIGHHSVVGAGTVVTAGVIPPYSLVVGNPMVVKEGYYGPAI